jgi:transposase
VTVKLRLSRWRCVKQKCKRRTFTDRLPEIASPHARRTTRVAEIVRLLGHSAGGLRGERLMKRLGMPVSDDTILRHLKRYVALGKKTPLRIVGIDDWSWCKSSRYGTIIVDLENREVVDVLPERTMLGTAEWLRQHPEIEIVNRDRCGLYAQGTREGAPHVRQIADRFHLQQNLRLAIEAQLSCADRSTGRALLAEATDEDWYENAAQDERQAGARHRWYARQTHRQSRQAVFDTVHALRP